MGLIVNAGRGSRLYTSGGGGGGGGGDNFFVADFTNPNANGPNVYNFDPVGRYAPGTNWVHTHLTSGGVNNKPAVQLTLLAGQDQYDSGFYTSALGGDFTLGDSVFFRWSVKFANDARWPATTRQAKTKFIMFGTTGTPQSRVIVYMQPPYESNGALGMRDYGAYEEADGQVISWARPSYFGKSGANDWTDVDTTGDQYGSFTQLINIEGWPHLNRPVLVSYGNKSSPPAPGPNSAASTDGWYHIQMECKSGTAGNVEFRTWANNDTQGSPTAERTGIQGSPGGLDVVGWDGLIKMGGFVDDAPGADFTYIVGRFEAGYEFRNDWYSSRTTF
jgi:hypothetical protein